MKRFVCIILSLAAALSCNIRVSAETISVSALSAVLMEAQTGQVIYSRNMHAPLPVASTTKIMTTLITLESGGLDDEFEIDSRALLTEGSSMYLCQGEMVSKRELCYGMMLPSGNDAANAAALEIGGEYDAFAEIMNRRASEIGMRNTHFVTPSGLHDDRHYSSAYDMALLAAEALENEEFREICGTKYLKLSDESWECDKYLRNSNKLLSRYEGCIGVKTGFTDEAGRCLVSAAERNGVTLIAVTLNAPDDWNDHIRMLDYGFANCSAEKYGGCTAELDVKLAGGAADSVKAVLSDIPAIVSVNGKMPRITEKIILPQFVYAPVFKGDILGRAEYYADGKLLASSDITAAEGCAIKEVYVEKSLYRFIIDKLKALF